MVATIPKVESWRPDADRPVFRYAEQKLDGRRAILRKDTTGDLTFKFRKSYVDMWPTARRLDSLFDASCEMPYGTAIVGEAHIPGVNRSGDVPAALQTASGWAFTPLSLLFWDGKLVVDMSYETLTRRVGVLGLELPERVDDTMRWSREDHLTYIEERGWEGLVLKLAPSFGWWKLKPVETMDLVVLSVYVHEHGDKLGGLVCGLVDGTEIVRVGGGFGKGGREALWDVREGLPGTVIEVAYERRAANGSLLFPRFSRTREDKAPEDCHEAT